MESSSSMVPSHLNSCRSRIEELKQIHRNPEEIISPSEADKVFHESALQFEEKLNQILSDAFAVDSLSLEDLGNLLDHLNKELRSVEGDNVGVESEVQELSMRYTQDYSKMESEVEGLSCYLDFLEAQDIGREKPQSACDKIEGNRSSSDVGSEFKIMELNHQAENKKNTLKALKDLNDKFYWLDAIEKIDEAFSGFRVVEFEQNNIRMSLRSYISSLDTILSQQRTEDISEPSEQDHELLIQLIDGTMEINNVEIFPNDVCISDIVETVKSLRTVFSCVPVVETGSSLEWLVRRVQHRIILSTIRHSIVKCANKSRYSLEYVDREEMIIAHLMGGLDLFIKVAYGWPILNAALRVMSIKTSSNSSKDTYTPYIFKVTKEANLLELHIRENITSFVDKIEEILATTNGY